MPSTVNDSVTTSAAPSPTSARRSYSSRCNAAGCGAGSSHCADTASRMFDIHHTPEYSAATRPMVPIEFRWSIAVSRIGFTASDSPDGTDAVMASSSSANSAGLNQRT